jgi:benzoylsuccinyl-CoA thiolase BbsB subunit
MTVFGRHIGRPFEDLGAEAVERARESSGIELGDIETVICANVLGGMLPGQRVMREFGFSDVPVINVENACASGGTALHLATKMIESGEREIVLVLGIEMLSVLGSGLLPLGSNETEVLQGINLPASYALRARRYMYDYGLTAEQLALVSVKSHRNAKHNEYAQFRQPWTIEDVLGAKMIADPFTLFMCCPNSDGAAAIVVCSDKITKRFTSTPMFVRASALVSGHFNPVRDLKAPETTVTATKKAYELAAMGPDDLDMIECHDPFAIAELLYYEIFGIAEQGGAAKLLESGATELGGRIPVNPSGGLMARGHPLGATGVAQAVEAFWQLSGTARLRQIEGAKTAFTHVTGGGISGYDNGACTVHIFTT